MKLDGRQITTEYISHWGAGILMDVLESSDNAIIIVDAEGTIVYVNRFYAECMNFNSLKTRVKGLM